MSKLKDDLIQAFVVIQVNGRTRSSLKFSPKLLISVYYTSK
jgi:hypothetical protein